MITNSFGKAFPSAIVIPSYGLMAIAVLVFIMAPLFGLVFFVLAAFSAFTTSGVDIDPDIEVYRLYTKYWGVLKMGEWKPMQHYPYISVLRRDLGTTVYNRVMHQQKIYHDTLFDVVLLSETHRHKVSIMRLKGNEKATEEARKLAKALSKKLTNYAPKISEKTKARRRR